MQSTPAPPQVIATVDSAGGYSALLEALRLACDLRQASYEAISEVAGLAPRYVNKLLAPAPIRNIGPNSLGPLLGALGVKLVVIEDTNLTHFTARLPRRKPGPTRHTRVRVRGKSASSALPV